MILTGETVFFSITCAHEGNHFIWRATSVFLTFVGVFGGAIAMMEAIRRLQ